MEIQDKVAVVTGGARGIGRATAVALAEAGARGVALVDLLEPELAETEEAVRKAGAEPLSIACDVSSLVSLRAMFAQVEARFGGLDILHNNAGVGEGAKEWPGLDPEQTALVCDVNLRGVILGTQLALPLMQAGGGGAVVNTASGAALAPLPPQAVYAATKAGVVHFTKSCSALAESHGVRVNCVLPGLVDTQMPLDAGGGQVPAWLKPMYDSVELLPPEAIASAVLDLVRDDTKNGEARVVGN